MKRPATFARVLLALTSPAQDRPVPKKIPIADGIVLFVTPPYGDVGLDGNAIAILSRDGVFVFDTNGTPRPTCGCRRPSNGRAYLIQ